MKMHTLFASAVLGAVVTACGGETPAPAPAAPAEVAPPAPAAPAPPPEPVQQALEGGPFPTVVLAQAWFWKDENGKPKPGPARLEIWRDNGTSWVATKLEDGDSNVFHKVMFYDGGLLTIAGDKAMLKKWTFADGKWSAETLWSAEWGGKFNRLRDMEVGDVDGDGKDELVIATHDSGVIAVVNPDEGPAATIELDRKADTFVHEIEIGDIDGDGKLEFFATPSDRNQANVSQEGGVVMYRWDGTTYQKTEVEHFTDTHAKEILAADIDGDGKDDLLAVMEAEIGANKEIVKPVEIRHYLPQKDGTFTHESLATIDDRQTRFLVPADLDEDGQTELVAAAMKSGVWLLDRGEDGAWKVSNIDRNSGGFEHATQVADLDGDGTPELYVAADDQAELKRYVFNSETGTYDATLLGKLQDSTFTWNMAVGQL